MTRRFSVTLPLGENRDLASRRRHLIRVAVLAIGVLAFVTLRGAIPIEAALPGLNGKIAFGDGTGISVINPDGSGRTHLPTTPHDFIPSWSPDGTQIAFVSTRDGNTEIYVMNADGSGQTRLTANLADDTGPAWSPDGTKIAFYSDRDGNSEIYVMNADGSGQTRLTTNPNPDFQPAWSPDGAKIALVRNVIGGARVELLVMNSDGSGETVLVSQSGQANGSPNWSPRGSKIAFEKTVFTGGVGTAAEIYVVNADGSGQINLSNNPAPDQLPTWSPDGTKIAFVTDRVGGPTEIYVMNSDGSSPTNLTNTPSQNEFRPDWQRLDFTVTITIATPPEGAVYTLGQVVLADYACTDQPGGLGLAACVGDVPDESPIDTGSVGSKAFSVDAADNAGNPAFLIHGYSVVYGFSGFFPSVDNPPVFNAAKAGNAVPAKFSLNGNQGLSIFAAGYPKSQQIACMTSAPSDVIEETATAGSSGLSYDAVTDKYIYVWKTDNAWANTCRKLTLRLKDGTDHNAYFSFKR